MYVLKQIAPLLLSLLHKSTSVKQTPAKDIVSSVHQCIHYTNKIVKLLGISSIQCVSCNPSTPFCATGCQNALDYQYVACEGVCLPDGFFFDPGFNRIEF